MLVERCSHSATYTCGFNCQFFHPQLNPWAVSPRNNRCFPSWRPGNPSYSTGSKRPGEKLVFEIPSKRHNSGRLTLFAGSFRPLIVLNDNDADPVIPRAVSRTGRTWASPVVVEEADALSAATAPESSRPPHRKELSLGTEDEVRREDAWPAWDLGTNFLKKPKLPDLRVNPRYGSPTHRRRKCRHKKTSRSRSLAPPSTLEECVRSLASEHIVDKDRQGLSDNQLVSAAPKKPRDTLTVKQRKHFFIHTPTLAMVAAMRKWVSETHALFNVARDEGDCWLHPAPASPKANGRARGTINRSFIWTDASGRHNVFVNYDVVTLIIDHHLTDEQQEGYITKGWHLSHLCGNWTCCNWRQFTVEAGSINISRNAYFMYTGGCNHSPKCMKDKKQRLLPVNPTRSLDSEGKDASALLGSILPDAANPSTTGNQLLNEEGYKASAEATSDAVAEFDSLFSQI
ncbi:hypothetical protein MMC08_003851 [Hypocenomyce scalaris]|nr:hypothetical protein [Hypocenomyce scalaris]